MRRLIEKYIFDESANRDKIFAKIKKEAFRRGVFLSSLRPLYEAINKGHFGKFAAQKTRLLTKFVIPAFNLRFLTFDMACAVFRAAKKAKASAFILEIARSEMEYANQTPQEFALCALGAAIHEKYEWPIFLQGDHFYLPNTTDQELKKLENLITQSITAGFYNLDIDCSGLELKENIKYTNHFIEFIKKNSPQGVDIAVGGEVGSIGQENTTSEQLSKFLKSVHNLNKVSCQTGTKHGGDVLPDGLMARLEIDFKLIKDLTKMAEHFGLPGIVQHGASTLQKEQFTQMLQNEVLEVHLSTIFQNIIFDSKHFPCDLREKIYDWLNQNFTDEQYEYERSAQFYYKTRKRALKVFKKPLWKMPEKNLKVITGELEKKFEFFLKTFKVNNSNKFIEKCFVGDK